MHLLSLNLQDHPGIGNLSITLTDEQENPYPVIVIAGSNGTGKSAIFEAIFNTLNFGPRAAHLGIVTLRMRLDDEEMRAFRLAYPSATNPVTLQHDTSIQSNWSAFVFSWKVGDEQVSSQFNGNREPVKRLLCLFSEAAVEYSIKRPSTVTTLQLDPEVENSKSSSAFGGIIAQLLVDIRNADAEDLTSWVDYNPDQPPPQAVKQIRFKRFIEAFEQMWPNKKFKGVSRTDGGMVVEFVEHGRVSSLETLSTGEKQVIIRGGFFLRHQGTIGGALLLLDEPELSLHPEWQSKVLTYYRHITRQRDGTQPQMIVATHSPFIVHGATDAKIIILEKNNQTGSVFQSPNPRFPISKESAAVHAFSLQTFLKGASLNTTVLTEGETDAKLIELAWQKLRENLPMPFQTKAALGAKNISITFNDQEFPTKLGSKTLIAVFDFDSEGFNQWNGAIKKVAPTGDEGSCLTKSHQKVSAFALLLPVPPHRKNLASLKLAGRSAMAIELLFEDCDIPTGMIETTPLPGGIEIPSVRSSAKTSFASHAESLTQEAFKHFEPLLRAIEDRLS